MTNRNKVTNFGYVSRMDNLQAAVLNFRLKNLKKVIKKRRENVKIYSKFLSKNMSLFLKKKQMNLILTILLLFRFLKEMSLENIYQIIKLKLLFIILYLFIFNQRQNI